MDIRTAISGVKKSIERSVVGKSEVIDLVLLALFCRGHVLIEDVPGIGKTTLVAALARSVGLSFKRIQFTPDIMPSDITGFSMPDLKTGKFSYHEGAVMSQIVLADEINRTSPKTQSSLLEAMQENQVTVDGVTYALPKPFMVLATQNPIEYLGTYPLPEAQLDRFFIKISLGYPSLDEETDILDKHDGAAKRYGGEPAATAEHILALQEYVDSRIFCAPEIKRYISLIAASTRSVPTLALGVSPRAAIALMTAAKGRALMEGREFVIPDDIMSLAVSVLAHRLVLKPEAKLRGISPSDILSDILRSVPVPGLS